MKYLRSTRFILRITATIFIYGASIIGPVHSADAIDSQLPAGVCVSVDEATGRNRIAIQVGSDLLAVNSLDASTTDQRPRYRLTTDALGDATTDTAIELWPESRPRGEAAAHAVVVFSTGFTLAAADREVVLFDLGRCATAGDAAVWLPKERILITGRMTSANRVEATTDSDLVAWIENLERLRGLGPELVVPGHGSPGGAGLLSGQIDRLHALREEVESGLLAGLSANAIANN